MLKAMVFIDGPWLGKSLEYLARKRGKRTLYTKPARLRTHMQRSVTTSTRSLASKWT